LSKILAVHSYKGGTGKTLLSINIAAAFAKQGKKVCLFDLDFRAPSLATLLKIDKSEYWMNDYLNGVCEINKVLVDLSGRIDNGGTLFVGLANPSTEAIRDMTARDRKWEMRALGRVRLPYFGHEPRTAILFHKRHSQRRFGACGHNFRPIGC
jgi:septum site-determining protein MinD